MDPVRMVFSKWGGRPHWEFDALMLGEDAHGTWLGLPQGTHVARPGAQIITNEDQVVLVPEAGFVATFYAPGPSAPCDVYVDISTTPVRDGAVVSAVDLDLDVVRGRTGRVWVDDEDEFADHRVRFAYPEDVVTAAVTACVMVRDLVQTAAAPFDAETTSPWFEMLHHRAGCDARSIGKTGRG